MRGFMLCFCIIYLLKIIGTIIIKVSKYWKTRNVEAKKDNSIIDQNRQICLKIKIRQKRGSISVRTS
jgi:hypothetical protein